MDPLIFKVDQMQLDFIPEDLARDLDKHSVHVSSILAHDLTRTGLVLSNQMYLFSRICLFSEIPPLFFF